MRRECEPLNSSVRQSLETEESHVHKHSGLESVCEETEHADKDDRGNCGTWYFFLMSVFLLAGTFFTAVYFRLNDACNRGMYTESSILNQESAIMPELDPCDDFYSFACGRWNQSASYNDNKSVIKEINARNLLRLECLLKRSSWKKLNPWGRYLVRTFRLCETDKAASIEKSKTVAFVKAAASPLLSDRYERSGVDHVLRRVHHKYLQSGLFFWDVILERKGHQAIQAVRIRPPENPSWNDGVPLNWRQHLVEYMKEILSLLGADRESLETVCEDVAEFMSLLRNRKELPRPRQQHELRKLVTYGEFLKLFDFIDFREYFREFPLRESVPVVIEDLDYFQWLGDRIKNSDKGPPVIQNFLYWSLIDFFVPHMPEAFGEARDKYANKLGKTMDRRHTCLNAVKKGMNFAICSLFMDKILDDKSKDMVKDIATHVKNSFRDSLYSQQISNDTRWLNELEGVFNNIHIGIPNHFRDMYDNKLPFAPAGDSFPSYYIAGTKFVKQKMISYIHKLPLASLFSSDFFPANGFFLNIPLLILNTAMVTPPIFHPSQPLSRNYAGLGFVLAHELAHSIHYLGQYSERIWMNLGFKLNCLQHLYNETKTSFFVPKEDFADNVGIQIAYKAYLEHVKHYHLESITLNDRKMFFLHYSQVFCDDGSSFNLEDNQIPHHSPFKDRINIPLSNFPEFAETFSCPIGSRMNYKNKCLI